MPLSLPPLPTLRVFEAAARHQSFKLAAEELGLTPSAISHGVATLEEWLGVELFERGPRGVTLSQAGSDYVPYITDALETIAIGTRRLPKARGERRVRISVAPTFALCWLLPRLGAFRALHPRIMVSVDTSQRRVSLSGEDGDFAIRMGVEPPPGLQADHLLRESLVAVAAPEYLARIRDPAGPLDWQRATLLRLQTVALDWAAWAEATRTAMPEQTQSLHFDTLQMIQEAAREGLGLAICRRPFVDEDLNTGRLVVVGPKETGLTSSYWLVSPSGTETRPEMIAFRRWLLGIASSETDAGPARRDRTSGLAHAGEGVAPAMRDQVGPGAGRTSRRDEAASSNARTVPPR